MTSDLYQEVILDHYQHPRHFGQLPGATHSIRESNASCGDMVELSMIASPRVNDLVIKQLAFRGIGCAVSIASTSILIDHILEKKMTLMEVASLGPSELAAIIGVEVTPTRVKCQQLGWRAFRALSAKYADSLNSPST